MFAIHNSSENFRLFYYDLFLIFSFVQFYYNIKVMSEKVRGWLHETGTNSDRCQSENIVNCSWNRNETKAMHVLANIAVRIPSFCSQQQCFSCSLPHRWLIWRGFAFSWRKFRIDPSSKWVRLVRAYFSTGLMYARTRICTGCDLKLCRSEFVPVSCNQPFSAMNSF